MDDDGGDTHKFFGLGHLGRKMHLWRPKDMWKNHFAGFSEEARLYSAYSEATDFTCSTERIENHRKYHCALCIKGIDHRKQLYLVMNERNPYLTPESNPSQTVNHKQSSLLVERIDVLNSSLVLRSPHNALNWTQESLESILTECSDLDFCFADNTRSARSIVE